MEQIIAQAGAITFREKKDELKILLVRSKKDPSRWIFPKGHIEFNETEEQTCKRELLEEAGVEGEIVAKAGNLEFWLNEKCYNVAYYLCKFSKKSGKGEPGREPKWFGVEETIEKLFFPNSRELLRSSLNILKNLTIK